MALLVVYGISRVTDKTALCQLHHVLAEDLFDPTLGIHGIGDVVTQLVPQLVPEYENCGLAANIEHIESGQCVENELKRRLEMMGTGIADALCGFAADHLPACEWVSVSIVTTTGVRWFLRVAVRHTK